MRRFFNLRNIYVRVQFIKIIDYLKVSTSARLRKYIVMFMCLIVKFCYPIFPNLFTVKENNIYFYLAYCNTLMVDSKLCYNCNIIYKELFVVRMNVSPVSTQTVTPKACEMPIKIADPIQLPAAAATGTTITVTGSSSQQIPPTGAKMLPLFYIPSSTVRVSTPGGTPTLTSSTAAIQV